MRDATEYGTICDKGNHEVKLKFAIALVVVTVLLSLGFWLGWRGADGRFVELREEVS